MSRRPLPHQIERLVRQQNQMAPGGRVWSESPIPRRYTPRVPMAGEDPPAPAGVVCVALLPDVDGHTFRPAGGATFGCPVPGAYFELRAQLTMNAGTPLWLRIYKAPAVLEHQFTIDAADAGPFTSGAVVEFAAYSSRPPVWTYCTLASGGSGSSWVTATNVEFCYSTTGLPIP